MATYRILYVDDEPDIREIGTMCLEADPDLEVRACASGPEALAILAGWRPDLVMLDVVMAEMDGPATLRAIRAEPAHAGLPVVFITARSQPDETRRLMSLGAAGVIPKPFDPRTLAATVKTYLPPR
jgi:CheY-like chemotaxis protein